MKLHEEAKPRAERVEDVAATLRRVLPDLYFVNAPTARLERHLQLLQRLPQEELILDFSRQPGATVTELTLCGYDDAAPGLLAKVSGTIAARRISVQAAFVFSVGAEKLAELTGAATGALERRVVLDTLLLCEKSGQLCPMTTATIGRVRDDLTRVLRGEVTPAQLLARSRLRPYAPLTIYELKACNAGGHTVITLRAADDAGFLYRTAAALAAQGLNIDIAQAKKLSDGAAFAVFYVVGGSGLPLTAPARQVALANLRIALESSVVPFGLDGT